MTINQLYVTREDLYQKPCLSRLQPVSRHFLTLSCQVGPSHREWITTPRLNQFLFTGLPNCSRVQAGATVDCLPVKVPSVDETEAHRRLQPGSLILARVTTGLSAPSVKISSPSPRFSVSLSPFLSPCVSFSFRFCLLCACHVIKALYIIVNRSTNPP